MSRVLALLGVWLMGVAFNGPSDTIMPLSSISFDKSIGSLQIINQLLLPEETKYEIISGVQDGWVAIKEMKIRGAPAIAILGSLSIAVEVRSRSSQNEFASINDAVKFINNSFEYLKTARPTAVNITEAANRFKKRLKELESTETDVGKFCDKIYDELSLLLEEDMKTNQAIGENGANHIVTHNGGDQVTILTHCNTGSLASAGYGTALGVIRALNDTRKLKHAYCTETRPYNQGSRLTAYELVHDCIPGTLICDSMCACLMKERGVSAVVVGADRVVSNGDTANKIGTYQLAVVALHHKIPFYVAAPFTTVDFNLSSGSEIVIEERKQSEMKYFAGKKTAPEEITCWNPAFDVTPAELITGGIITERGVFRPEELKSFMTDS
jgi:methylthioribose-1-phosphate isomerase